MHWAGKLQATGGNVPRISTFGIGPYTNHVFLKQLATTGRGFYDKAFTPGTIPPRTLHTPHPPEIAGVI